MKELLLLRHAKSSWDNPHLSDFERPLNQRGRYDAPRMGELLHQKDLLPGLILSSPAVRAATTAELVALAAGYAGTIQLIERLYHGSPDNYLGAVREAADPHQRVMLVAHNPGMEECVELLAGRWEQMPTAAVAYFQLALERWADLAPSTPATLKSIWRPKELDK
jgi:phosphohistidine phosphatase